MIGFAQGPRGRLVHALLALFRPGRPLTKQPCGAVREAWLVPLVLGGLLAFAHCTWAATLDGFQPGQTTMDLVLSAPADVSGGRSLVVEGENGSGQPAVLVIRVDDAASTDYASRADVERTVPPGHFQVRTTAGDWRTPSGRMVDGSALRRVVLSVGHGGPQVTITAVGTGPGAALPSGVAVVRFGPADGFQPGQTAMDLVLSAPADVSGGRSLVVEGENGSGQPAVLVIRVDDAASTDYASRADVGRTAPPGHFQIRTTAADWRTPSGRMVDGSAVRRIVLSTGDGGPQVKITAVGTGPGAALPPGAVRFGPADGFEPGQTTMDLVLSAPADVSGGRSLVVEGENGSGQPAALVIRVDDAASTGYASRADVERTVPPGHFQIRTSPVDWRTPSGRMVAGGALRRVVLSVGHDGPQVKITAVGTDPGAGPPSGSSGVRFGRADGFQPGQTTMDVVPAVPADFSGGHDLLVDGENGSGQPIVLVIRIDDAASTGYATRTDLERTVLPGRFRVRSSAGEWRTPSGRMLDGSAVRRIILSSGYGGPQVRITAIGTGPGPALPSGAAGFQFGPANGAVFPGFSLIAPGDPRIPGGTTPVVRPGAHPLIGSGLLGVTRFETPWPDGHWTVSAWTEDMGEWELLPHPLVRRISVNGQILMDRRMTAREWVDTVYLAGRDTESLDLPWAVFGGRRGGLVTADVTVTNGRLVLEQAGDSRDATFLSAVLVEPAGNRRGLAAVEAARRERFAEDWPVIGRRTLPPPDRLLVGVVSEDRDVAPDWRPMADMAGAVVAAPGTVAWVDVVAVAPADDPHPSVTLSPPEAKGTALRAEWRWGQWRYARSPKGFLTPTASLLRGEKDRMGLQAGVPRRINVLVYVPEDSAPGLYSGSVDIAGAGGHGSASFVIDVPPVRLPPADRPIGIYHEDPAYMAWFPDLADGRGAAMACDLDFMHRLGMTGLAPPLSTPYPGHAGAIADELAQVRRSGFALPVLAYAPVKRVIERDGIAGLAPVIAETAAALRARGLPAPVWSIADEPGNAGSSGQDLAAIRAALKAADPDAVVAAHLNGPGDRKLLHLFDLALVNTGYGVSAGALDGMVREGVVPWLYNMPDPEAAAGFFLWRSGARGYLQWHGRATGSDPYDPTDGREGDVQFLPVGPGACQAVPDVDMALLRMARGIGDLRWMLWLERQAATNADARSFLGEVTRRIPDRWAHGEALALDKSALRRDLASLARRIGESR